MTYAKPAFRHPDARTNDVGCTRRDYEGGLSTLCAGCGHDSISAAIIDACFELSIEPHRVAKTLRHRLLVENARLLSQRLAQL